MQSKYLEAIHSFVWRENTFSTFPPACQLFQISIINCLFTPLFTASRYTRRPRKAEEQQTATVPLPIATSQKAKLSRRHLVSVLKPRDRFHLDVPVWIESRRFHHLDERTRVVPESATHNFVSIQVWTKLIRCLSVLDSDNVNWKSIHL